MREPDVVFMRAENAARRKGKFWDGADLAIEVVSPEKPERDLVIKRHEYERAGIPEYWIVDPPARSISVYRLENAVYVLHGRCGAGDLAVSALLPGFSVDVETVFSYDGS
jgi:Uma2 family endonuclease